MRSCATAQRLRARHFESKDNINWQNSIDKPLPTRYNIIRWSGTSCPVDVAELCNGSTHDSDSCCLGSNPSSAAIFASMVKRLRHRPLTAKTGVRVPMEVPSKNPENTAFSRVFIFAFHPLFHPLLFFAAQYRVKSVPDHCCRLSCFAVHIMTIYAICIHTGRMPDIRFHSFQRHAFIERYESMAQFVNC